VDPVQFQYSMENSVKILSNTSFIVLLVTLVLISSCSKEEEETKAVASTTTMPAQKMQPTPSTSVLPPNHPTTMPQNLPKASPQNMPQQTITPPANPGQAKVIKAMHASGYTYMNVELGDRKTWVAATSMRIKAGDTVKWESAAVMRNFTSKTLRRTFDEILFVSNASAVTGK